jgi:hypothetical protein
MAHPRCASRALQAALGQRPSSCAGWIGSPLQSGFGPLKGAHPVAWQSQIHGCRWTARHLRGAN